MTVGMYLLKLQKTNIQSKEDAFGITVSAFASELATKYQVNLDEAE